MGTQHTAVQPHPGLPHFIILFPRMESGAIHIQPRCGLRLILVTVQKLRYMHQNPVRAGLVARPEDWLYSSAGNYLHEKGLLEMPLLWPDFATDGGWFFGTTDFPLLQWSRSGAWTVIVV